MSDFLPNNFFEKFREKLEEIQLLGYQGLVRELIDIGKTKFIAEELLKSVCIVQTFTVYTMKTIALYKQANGAIRAEAIQNWRGEEKCGREEEQRRAYRVK